MTDNRRATGDKGEELAKAFLSEKGYVVLEKNIRLFRREIDLICLDGEEVVFVEVKTRQGSKFGYPEESVTPKKVQHIATAAEGYLQQRGWSERLWRIDVVAILLKKQGENEILHLPAIDISEKIW